MLCHLSDGTVPIANILFQNIEEFLPHALQGSKYVISLSRIMFVLDANNGCYTCQYTFIGMAATASVAQQ